MSPQEQENIEFILGLSNAELLEWVTAIWETGDAAEIDYALSMIQKARTCVELELLAVIDEESNEDCSQATQYLQRFC